MGDGAIGQHALDVGLRQRAEVSDEHGEHRENPERPEPQFVAGRHGGQDPQQQREGAGFGPEDMSAVTGVGAPS